MNDYINIDKPTAEEQGKADQCDNAIGQVGSALSGALGVLANPGIFDEIKAKVIKDKETDALIKELQKLQTYMEANGYIEAKV